MILECPNCDTQYEIPVELPPEGRKVRCVSCEHIWQAMPPEESAEPDSAVEQEAALTADDDFAAPAPEVTEPVAQEAAPAEEDAATATDEPAPETPPSEDVAPNLDALDAFADEEIVFKDDEPEVAAQETPPETESAQPETAQELVDEEPSAEPPAESDVLSDSEMEDAFSAAIAEAGLAEDEEPESEPIVIGKARKKKGVSFPANIAAGWAALALVLTGILSIGYFQRVTVVKLLPGAASTYEKIGLPVNVRGLNFEGVKYSWETSAGRPVLEVNGEIRNITSQPMKVPTVVFGLRTKEKVEVYQWAADVRAEMLPPGEKTLFSAQIPTPPKSIRDVQVRFAKVQ